MNAKPKGEGLQSPSGSIPCWHINEENCRPFDINTQRPLWLEEKIGLLGIDHDKGLLA
jgi:hypothetical protein